MSVIWYLVPFAAVGFALISAGMFWVPCLADDSLAEAIRRQNKQLEKNLQQEKQNMRDSKFYWGWHEGYHWDPNNGWHRWNHQGLYDPNDPNVTVRSRE